MTWFSAWDCKPFCLFDIMFSLFLALLDGAFAYPYCWLLRSFVWNICTRDDAHFLSRPGCSGLGLGLHCIMARSKFMTRECEATGPSVWFRAWKAPIEWISAALLAQLVLTSQAVLDFVMFKIPDDICGIHWPFYDERNKSVWGFSLFSFFFFFLIYVSSNIYYH